MVPKNTKFAFTVKDGSLLEARIFTKDVAREMRERVSAIDLQNKKIFAYGL